MAFKTKRDLLEWLEQGDGTGQALIGRDWLIFVDAGGNIVAQHPTCPDMGTSFWPVAEDMDFRQVFADPDDVCESEYRAIYTTLEEVLPGAPAGERAEMCRGILESYVRSAQEMLALLDRQAEGRSE